MLVSVGALAFNWFERTREGVVLPATEETASSPPHTGSRACHAP